MGFNRLYPTKAPAGFFSCPHCARGGGWGGRSRPLMKPMFSTGNRGGRFSCAPRIFSGLNPSMAPQGSQSLYACMQQQWSLKPTDSLSRRSSQGSITSPLKNYYNWIEHSLILVSAMGTPHHTTKQKFVFRVTTRQLAELIMHAIQNSTTKSFAFVRSTLSCTLRIDISKSTVLNVRAS